MIHDVSVTKVIIRRGTGAGLLSHSGLQKFPEHRSISDASKNSVSAEVDTYLGYFLRFRGDHDSLFVYLLYPFSIFKSGASSVSARPTFRLLLPGGGRVAPDNVGESPRESGGGAEDTGLPQTEHGAQPPASGSTTAAIPPSLSDLSYPALTKVSLYFQPLVLLLISTSGLAGRNLSNETSGLKRAAFFFYHAVNQCDRWRAPKSRKTYDH